MPYIKQARRPVLEALISELLCNIESDGEVNYVITRIIDEIYKGTYESMSAGVGVLETAKHEFIRRRLNPYEDKKIKENGDVY